MNWRNYSMSTVVLILASVGILVMFWYMIKEFSDENNKKIDS